MILLSFLVFVFNIGLAFRKGNKTPGSNLLGAAFALIAYLIALNTPNPNALVVKSFTPTKSSTANKTEAPSNH